MCTRESVLPCATGSTLTAAEAAAPIAHCDACGPLAAARGEGLLTWEDVSCAELKEPFPTDV